MSITVQNDESDPDFVILSWIGQEGDPPLENPPGVGNMHTTRIDAGRVRFTYYDDPDNPIELDAGEEIVLDVRRGYRVDVVGRGEHRGRCFYPRANAAAIAEIEHLRKGRAIILAYRTAAQP